MDSDVELGAKDSLFVNSEEIVAESPASLQGPATEKTPEKDPYDLDAMLQSPPHKITPETFLNANPIMRRTKRGFPGGSRSSFFASAATSRGKKIFSRNHLNSSACSFL